MGRDEESNRLAEQAAQSCAVVQPLLPAAALGALEPDQHGEVALHLLRCRDCRRDFDTLRDTVEALAFAVPDRQPPPALRARFLAALEASSRSISRRWMAVAALAAGLALVLLTSNAVLWLRLDDARADLAAIEARRRAAASLPLVWYDLAAVDSAATGTPTGARGTLCAQDGGDVAWLITEDLPALPAGHVYQAWLWAGDEQISAGTFRVDDRGRGFLIIRLSRPIRAFTALGVSAEAGDGSPVPSDRRILYGAI